MLYRWERQPVEGIIDPSTYLLPDHLEWITPDGRLQVCSFSDCKALCFVSEASKADLFLEHNLFDRRPRVAGLWTRFLFRDGAKLDGVLSHNLLEWPAFGYFLVPPQARASRQRVFVPRAAIVSTELRGVIGAGKATAGRQDRKASLLDRQLSIFDV